MRLGLIEVSGIRKVVFYAKPMTIAELERRIKGREE